MTLNLNLDEVVSRYEQKITERLATGKTTQEQVDKVGLVDSDMELFAYQTLQSRAFASGKISFDVAQWLYRTIGGEYPTKKRFNAQSPAKRAVVTQLMGELLTK